MIGGGQHLLREILPDVPDADPPIAKGRFFDLFSLVAPQL